MLYRPAHLSRAHHLSASKYQDIAHKTPTKVTCTPFVLMAVQATNQTVKESSAVKAG